MNGSTVVGLDPGRARHRRTHNSASSYRGGADWLFGRTDDERRRPRESPAGAPCPTGVANGAGGCVTTPPAARNYSQRNTFAEIATQTRPTTTRAPTSIR